MEADLDKIERIVAELQRKCIEKGNVEVDNQTDNLNLPKEVMTREKENFNSQESSEKDVSKSSKHSQSGVLLKRRKKSRNRNVLIPNKNFKRDKRRVSEDFLEDAENSIDLSQNLSNPCKYTKSTSINFPKKASNPSEYMKSTCAWKLKVKQNSSKRPTRNLSKEVAINYIPNGSKGTSHNIGVNVQQQLGKFHAQSGSAGSSK